MNRRNFLRAIGAASVLEGLAGCGDTSDHFEKEGQYEGYNVFIGLGADGRRIIIDDKSGDITLYSRDRNNDKRFDEMEILTVPKGHPFENYANFKTLEEIYQAVLAQEE